MEPPDLDRMWETFVRVGPEPVLREGRHIDVLRREIAPVVVDLAAARLTEWYSFLLHGHESGVPTSPDDTDAYWHIRVSLAPGVSPSRLADRLPRTWLFTRPIARETVERIGGIASASLRSGDIRLAWRTIGEESELLLHLLDCYRSDIAAQSLVPDLAQYLHYLSNMTQLVVGGAPKTA